MAIQGQEASIGLTDFAVHAIQDIVFLELPPKGKSIEAMKPFGVIESVKAVFDLNAPLGGTVLEVNSALLDNFDPLVADPYGKGWLLKIQLNNPDSSQLLDAAAYDAFCASGQH